MFKFKMPYKDRTHSSETDRESEEGLLEKPNTTHHASRSTASRIRSGLFGLTTHILVFIVALWIGREVLPNQIDMNRIQHWSSVVKDVDITYTPTRFNGSFLHENVYRQDAGDEVDQAWEDLGVNYRALAIPEDEAEDAGLSASHVRINPKYGGGYPANVEGLHHLHCLNLLRMSLSWNFDYYKKKGHGAFSNEMHIIKPHVTHCLDIIRQQLMCTVDTGVMGQIWWGTEQEPEGFVDFNTVHMCKNYDDIRKWAEVRQLPEADTTPADFLMPPRSAEDVLPDIP